MTLELLFDRIALAAGLLALVSSLVAWRWRRSRPLLIPCFIITALLTGVALWHNHRPLPSNERRMLFQGVEYVREVRPGREDPKIVHVVRIDLTTPGLSFLVTPHDPVGEYEQAALTTSSFLRANHLSLAINADGFQPWEPGDLLNFYPREGDGITLHVPSVSLGDRYSDGYSPPGSVPTLHLSAQNQASINSTHAHPYNLISGCTRWWSTVKRRPGRITRT
ncbi:MAG: hypothetical protein IPK19_34725 [Chloroflexi bacterium]|nr:hypothetical protein [Chloroflexota bacterium]